MKGTSIHELVSFTFFYNSVCHYTINQQTESLIYTHLHNPLFIAIIQIQKDY